MKFAKCILIFLIAFTACKSSKTTTDDNNTVALKNLSSKKLAKKHIATYFDRNTIDAKLKVDFKNKKQDVDLSVRMRIKKDEVIWLKGTKFITVFKAKITPNKVSFYSPYLKNYIEGDFTILKEILGVEINFEQLQNMLLGQALFNLKAEKHTVSLSNDAYMLTPKEQTNFFKIMYWLNPNNFKLDQQSVLNESKNQRLDIAYPTYKKIGNTLFPEKIKIKAKDTNSYTNINMVVRSVEFDTAITTPFKIPSGYKEIKL